MLLANFVLGLVVLTWVAGNMAILFYTMKRFKILRITNDCEETGMDLAFFDSRDNSELVSNFHWNEKLLLALLSYTSLSKDVKQVLSTHPSLHFSLGNRSSTKLSRSDHELPTIITEEKVNRKLPDVL